MPKYFSVIKGSKSDLNEGVILTNNNLQLRLLSFKQNNRIKYRIFFINIEMCMNEMYELQKRDNYFQKLNGAFKHL